MIDLMGRIERDKCWQNEIQKTWGGGGLIYVVFSVSSKLPVGGSV